MNPKTILRRWVETALDNMGQDPEETVREGYSGRGMYGDTCLGFVLDSTAQIAMLAVELSRQAMFEAADARILKNGWSREQCALAIEMEADTNIDIVTNLFDAAREDSMGHGVIVYFPGWTLADEED